MATIDSTTPYTWQDYEEAVFQECERVYRFHNAEIVKNAHIEGRYSGVNRQIDVLVRLCEGGKVISTILVECKHYKQKINVKIVESFIGCLEDVGADKGIIVSENGFSRAAINRAHYGKDDIEVDILNLGELQQFQSLGAFPDENYDMVLDEVFGERGTTKREVWEMRACCAYVSQALRQARIDSGMLQEELFSKWGLKDDSGALAHAENGNRVLPYKYLNRHLEGLGLKAVIVRPGLIDWNPISRTHSLEEMRTSIGETVYRWKRKEAL